MAYNNTDLVILGEKIALGQSKTINFSFAKLYTSFTAVFYVFPVALPFFSPLKRQVALWAYFGR